MSRGKEVSGWRRRREVDRDSLTHGEEVSIHSILAEDESRATDERAEGTQRGESEDKKREETTKDKTNTDEEQQAEETWQTHWGNTLQKRQDDDAIRIQTININTFPKRGSPKLILLKKMVAEADVTGISEINMNHYRFNWISGAASNIQRMLHKGRTTIEWLRDREWQHDYQQGGVGVATQGQLQEYFMEEGGDQQGLGRWTWQKFEGRDNIRTAIIQIYRPVRNKKDAGSTYRQQSTKREGDPLQNFDKDLEILMEEMKEKQYRMIIMGDFNQDMEGNTTITRLMERQGLNNLMRERHGNGPPSRQKGTKVIDAIWASPSIQMTRGGCKGGEPILSDHRVVWADITMDSILGTERGLRETPQRRRMKTTHKKALKKFNSILQKQIKNHKLVEKARALWKDIKGTGNMTEEQQQQFHTIDQQRIRAMVTAEKRSRKFRPNEIQFSPALQEAFCDIEVQRHMYYRKKKNKKVNISSVKRIKARWQIEKQYDITLDQETTKRYLEKAHQTFYQIQKEAPDLREEFLAKQVREAEEKGNIQKAKEITTILENERNKSTHRRIKGARGMLERKGVRFIELQRDDGTKEVTDDKELMEMEIAESNQKRVAQANNTETRQGPVGALLKDGDYDRWEEVIQGEWDIPLGTRKGTQLWLEYIQEHTYEERMIEISTEKYIQTWNKVKEDTSSAPSALNFSTMKAMKWNKRAAELHTIMANITLNTGIYPNRWEECVNSMLPKKKDQWQPDQLRLTSLLMADFNHNNKIIGRTAMRWAEERGLLADEQYGSRKRLSAELHALNKRLTLDILQAQRRPGVIIANDAKSCYDRILHFAAYSALRRAGVSRKTIHSMLEPIRKMSHKIRTAYGDSFTTYGGEDWERDPHGILQGNGAGPAIWALVSSPLLEILRQQGFGAKLYGAIGCQVFHMCGFAFVDDADIIQTGHLFEDSDKVLEKAQTELTLWEELIKATGGALVPGKSDYSVINFQWDKEGRWSYEAQKRNRRIRVKDSEGQLRVLANPSTTTARRTLGVWQAIDGNEKEQTQKMEDKTKTWVKQINNSSLSRNDVETGVRQSLYPSITYGLGATALNKKQCQRIDTAVRPTLSKMGYCKYLPRALMYGHKDHGGVGLKDITTSQGAQHIKLWINEAGSGSPTDKLMQLLLESHILEIGFSGNILDWTYDKIEPLMTRSWIKHTLHFLADTELRITGNKEELSLWRENDTMIMEDILGNPGTTYTREEQQAINRCRVYLQIVTVSDMMEGSGTSILEIIWNCQREFQSTSGKAYRWPAQQRPGPASIASWQQALRNTHGIAGNNLQTI